MHRLAAYLKEREGFDCIVMDEGFASYRIAGEECYIRDIWVHSDYRQKNIASLIADRIEHAAIQSGCKYLSGSVSTTANHATESCKVLLAYGFEVYGAVQDGIFFRKEL
jgi:ribosomal protein S18 acetylase RimI-like enzyme